MTKNNRKITKKQLNKYNNVAIAYELNGDVSKETAERLGTTVEVLEKYAAYLNYLEDHADRYGDDIRKGKVTPGVVSFEEFDHEQK